MPKTISVTMSVSFNVEVPNLWMKEDRYVDEITGAVTLAVESSNKKVVIDTENIETSYDDLTPEE
jgi:hypothetical protein